MKLSDLNNEQLEAVKATKGPVLVFAGAGTGKTRVLTYKVWYLIKNKIYLPKEILALTFTNKAASEMRWCHCWYFSFCRSQNFKKIY